MAGNIFKQIFSEDPHVFKTISEVDRFVERKTGKKLKVKFVHSGAASCRGSVFERTSGSSADSIFTKTLFQK